VAKRFAIVISVPTVSGIPKTQPTVKEQHAYTKINPANIVGADGRVSSDDMPKLLKLMQDNVDEATAPYRTNPLIHGEVHRQVRLTSGSNATIRHGLQTPFGSWKCVRAYPGSSPFAAVEAANNGDLPVDQYLVLAAHASGTYDIEINPS